MDKDNHISMSDLYPDLSPEEQEEALENLRAYLRVVKKIYDGMDKDELKTLLLREQWRKRDQNTEK